MKRKLITYWEFTISVTGPRGKKFPSTRLRQQVQEAARRAAKNTLPAGFQAKVY